MHNCIKNNIKISSNTFHSLYKYNLLSLLPDNGSLAMQRMLGRGMTISCCRVSFKTEEELQENECEHKHPVFRVRRSSKETEVVLMDSRKKELTHNTFLLENKNLGRDGGVVVDTVPGLNPFLCGVLVQLPLAVQKHAGD